MALRFDHITNTLLVEVASTSTASMILLPEGPGAVVVASTASASSTATGALQVWGGAGIGGNLYVGGTIFGTVSVSGTISTATNIQNGTAGQVPYQTGPGLTSFFGPGTKGEVLVSQGTAAPSYQNTLTLTSTVAATNTNTGALQVRGGVGIGGDLFATSVKVISYNTDGNATPVPLDVQGAWMRVGDATTAFSSPSGIGIKLHDSGNVHYSMGITGTNFVISNTGVNGDQLFPAGKTDIISLSNAGIVTIPNNTSPTTAATGALVEIGRAHV